MEAHRNARSVSQVAERDSSRRIPSKENLHVEFKSEKHRPQSDAEIIDNIVAFANAEGGTLYLGVEDDGTITGASSQHVDISGLAAFVYNQTVPPISVRADVVVVDDCDVVEIEVLPSQQIVASKRGRIVQRRLRSGDVPEVVPMYPSQFIARLSQQREYDYSDQPAPGATMDDLDSRARILLRERIRQTHGDQHLLALSYEDFDRALDLVVEGNEGMQPSISGLLMIGTVESLRRCIPTAQASFQVLSGTSPRKNDDPFILPLVQMFDYVDALMQPWNSNHEIKSGLIHVNISDFDYQAFREAMVNAFCHRDYTEMSPVRFRIDDEGLTISNPGGFIQGVDTTNLLSAQPHSRNRQLSSILKTAGYAEQIGRGVDVIYQGAISSSGTLPDYSQSNVGEVVLFLRRAVPDAAFARMITGIEQRRNASLSLWELIVLSLLAEYHRLTVGQMHEYSHVDTRRLNSAIEGLVEEGVVVASGSGASRSFILGTLAYEEAGNREGFLRQREMSKGQRMNVIIDLARANGDVVTTAQVMDRLGLSYISAYRMLKTLQNDEILRHEGSGPSSRYRIVKSR